LSQSFLLQSAPRRLPPPTAIDRSWEKLDGPAASGVRGPLRHAVRALDEWMRIRQGIFEFSDNPNCMLRISREIATRAHRLEDGTELRAGDRILDVHFWNERMPQAAESTGLGWGGRFGRRLVRSFTELAEVLRRDPAFSDVVAIRARLAFAGARSGDDCRRFGAWFGFEAIADPRPPRLKRRLAHLGEDLWLLALTYTFNPGGLHGRALLRRRDDLWISRDALMTRYAARARRAPTYREPARVRPDFVPVLSLVRVSRTATGGSDAALSSR